MRLARVAVCFHLNSNDLKLYGATAAASSTKSPPHVGVKQLFSA